MRPGDIARQRDRFPTTSMHGLRWPLAVAQMWVGLLRDGPGDPDTTREVVEALQHALDQIGERVTDVELLTASMPGRLALDARRVTIAELAASLSPPPQVVREGDRVEVDVDPALSTRILRDLWGAARTSASESRSVHLEVETVHPGGERWSTSWPVVTCWVGAPRPSTRTTGPPCSGRSVSPRPPDHGITEITPEVVAAEESRIRVSQA